MRRLLSAALLSLAWIGFAVADDAAPSPAPPLPAEIRPLPTPLVPQPVPRLQEDVQYLTRAPQTPNASAPAIGPATADVSKVQHLREAARHLEAAGYSEESQKLRQTADELVESAAKVLKEKRAALQQLQGEIAELEQSIGVQPQIVLRCRVVEFDRAALKKLGFERFPGNSSASRGALYGLEDLVDTLLRQESARVLAEPTLVTTNNRPASLRSGGEFPIIVPAGGDNTTVQWRDTGLSIEAVPVCVGDDRLRLDLSVEIAEPDFEHGAVRVDGNLIPGLTTRRVNTQIEMNFGETKVLGGMFSQRDTRTRSTRAGTAENGSDDRQDTEMVVIVTAESVRGELPAGPECDGPAVVPAPR